MPKVSAGDIISVQRITWTDGQSRLIWEPAVVRSATESTVIAVRLSDGVEVAFMKTSVRWRQAG